MTAPTQDLQLPTRPLVALVTGASSGIGAATALRLARDGYTVHGIARRKDRLEQIINAARVESGSDGYAHAADVRDTDALAEIIGSIGNVDVLVNNAGLGRMEHTLAGVSIEDISTTVNTNVTSVLTLTRLVLPSMISNRTGHVVNIGSMAGLYPLPATLYGATKGAIHLMSLNLRLELKGTGVRVTEICPGRVSTEFYDVAIDTEELRNRIKNSGVAEVSAAECADAIAYALAVPAHVNINRIELQPTEQTYGGSRFDPVQPAQHRSQT